MLTTERYIVNQYVFSLFYKNNYPTKMSSQPEQDSAMDHTLEEC